MTPHQALEVFNPDTPPPPKPIQWQAYKVLRKALEPLSDSTEAEGETTKTQNKER